MRRAWLMIAAAILAGCVGQGPQRPSRRMGQAPEADTSQLALMELNQRMAAGADEEVQRWTQAQEERYALYDLHAWISVIERGDMSTPELKYGQRIAVEMQVSDISGRLLIDSRQECIIGSRELPAAVEHNLTSFHPGTRLRMAIPWYSAYGMQGNDNVPPYTNVIINLKVQ